MSENTMSFGEVEETARKTRRSLTTKLSDRINDMVDDSVERLERDKKLTLDHAEPQAQVLNVWLRWEIDPKTKQRTTLLGVHSSFRSAQLAMPKEFQELAMKYPADSPYIANFLNKAIERRPLED